MDEDEPVGAHRPTTRPRGGPQRRRPRGGASPPSSSSRPAPSVAPRRSRPYPPRSGTSGSSPPAASAPRTSRTISRCPASLPWAGPGWSPRSCSTPARGMRSRASRVTPSPRPPPSDTPYAEKENPMTADLTLRPADECRYDALALGEVMLRLDPEDFRIRTARSFRVWDGGGEYNVVRGLRRVFGLRGGVLTALVDNEVGRLVEDFILTGGLDTSHIVWVASDGVGRTARNGLNFTERGFGVRGAVGVSDRGHTAISQLKPGDIDFDHLFGELGARWLHTGGIFAALSESAAEVAIEAVKAARKHGTVVSYDLNYRPSLWKAIGGQAKAQEVNKAIAAEVDVMIGNEEDFTASLGFEVEGVDENLSALEVDKFAV